MRSKIFGAILSVWASSACTMAATDTYYFSNPQNVNQLERWNPNGTYSPWLATDGNTYGNVISQPNGNGYILGTVDYNAHGSGWRPSQQLQTIRYTFDRPKTIDRVSVSWRPAHNEDNFVFRDQTNTPFVTFSDPVNGTPTGTTFYTFAPRTVTYIEFESLFDANNTHPVTDTFEINGVGAYLAPGQRQEFDGTFNIFFDETFVQGVNRFGFDDSGQFTDHLFGQNGVKPAGGAAGSTTWKLSQAYNITGAFISHFDTGRFLADAKIEVSLDNVSFTTIWDDADNEYRFRSEAAPRDLGYIVLDPPFNSAFPLAQYVRLSWGANASPVELSEFQLFGFIPEPGSIGLVALGAGLMSRRRR